MASTYSIGQAVVLSVSGAGPEAHVGYVTRQYQDGFDLKVCDRGSEIDGVEFTVFLSEIASGDAVVRSVRWGVG
jgi:hypothetical protein